MKAPRTSKINNIQALRAFAALSVVIFHTGYIFPWGHAIGGFGVDVFFVISGYIMARICDTNASFFFRRRVIRIVPPYWALTLLLFGFSFWFPDLLRNTRPHGGELLKSLFFIPFIKDDGLIRPILFVGWSLNYEMFFYVAVALGLLVLRRRPLLFASVFILAIAAACHQFGRGDAITRFLGNGRIIEFPLGALAYTLTKAVSSPLAARIRLLSASVVAVSAFYLVHAEAVERYWPVLGWSELGITSFVLILGVALLSKGGWDTQLAWVVLIGDASYILYLVHPYCIYLIQRVLVPHLPWLDITHLFGSVFGSLIALGVAVVLHLKAELPTVAFLNKRFGGHRPSTEFKTTP